MNLFSKTPATATYTLRVLAHLLRYPDAQFRAHIPEMQTALQNEAALAPVRLAEVAALLRYLEHAPALEVESQYVELFDRGRRTALHLFEHVHGDSRERGPAMVDLIQTYEKGGMYLGPEELPDHLPVLLEFASTQPSVQSREFLGEIAHIVRNIFSALTAQKSPYASVLAAVLELAGEKAETVPLAPEPSLDESWAEPEVFGGCSTEGQAKPGQPQPIKIVRKPTQPTQGAQA
jgi:nitrate reductase delta subunit